MATDSHQRHVGDRVRLIVPLSNRLISRYFVGAYRTKQFGYSSAITNITLVLATTLTGYLAEVNWHLPFLVYLFPFISIFLTHYLKKDLSSYHPSDDIPSDTAKEMGKRGMNVKALIKLMAFYGLATYLVIIISFNLPFLMEEYGLSSGRAGILISLFSLLSWRGLCAEQDSASVGASHLYGLFVDDSLWDGNYFAQPF